MNLEFCFGFFFLFCRSFFFSSLHSMKIEWWLMRTNLDPDFCYRKKILRFVFVFFYSWEKATTHHTPIQTNKSFQFRNPDFLIKKRLSYWNEKNYYVVICVCMCLFCSFTIIIWCSFSGQKKKSFSKLIVMMIWIILSDNLYPSDKKNIYWHFPFVFSVEKKFVEKKIL